MKKQIFIVIEGIDGSGKTTQVNLLKEHFESEGKKVLLLDYPKYDDESCIGVKRYLNGEYGNINDINLYQASLFYAVNRLDDYLKNIKPIINQYDIVLSNRYTTSNLIHQGAKIAGMKHLDEKEFFGAMYEFKEWLENLEYGYLDLPKPDKVIFLDVEPTQSVKNIDIRGNQKDGHENIYHLSLAYKSAKFWTKNISTWYEINCLDNGKMKDKSEIKNNILKIVNGKM